MRHSSVCLSVTAVCLLVLFVRVGDCAHVHAHVHIQVRIAYYATPRYNEKVGAEPGLRQKQICGLHSSGILFIFVIFVGTPYLVYLRYLRYLRAR